MLCEVLNKPNVKQSCCESKSVNSAAAYTTRDSKSMIVDAPAAQVERFHGSFLFVTAIGLRMISSPHHYQLTVTVHFEEGLCHSSHLFATQVNGSSRCRHRLLCLGAAPPSTALKVMSSPPRLVMTEILLCTPSSRPCHTTAQSLQRFKTN